MVFAMGNDESRFESCRELPDCPAIVWAVVSSRDDGVFPPSEFRVRIPRTQQRRDDHGAWPKWRTLSQLLVLATIGHCSSVASTITKWSLLVFNESTHRRHKVARKAVPMQKSICRPRRYAKFGWKQRWTACVYKSIDCVACANGDVPNISTRFPANASTEAFRWLLQMTSLTCLLVQLVRVLVVLKHSHMKVCRVEFR